MLDPHDKIIIKEIVERIVDKRVDRVENKIDKILKIVTSSNQEHSITKVKVNSLEKRMSKAERKLLISPPETSSVFS